MSASPAARLGWLSELQAKPDPILVAGPGFVTTGQDSAAHASLDSLLRGQAPGFVVRASAMLALRCKSALRYVLVKGSASGVDGNEWQFPSTFCREGELPMFAARRALDENLLVQGDFRGWGEGRMDVGGPEFFYVTPAGMLRGTGRFVLNERVLDFFYPVLLNVASWDSVTLRATRGVGRLLGTGVKALPRQAVFAMVGTGELSHVTERLCEIAEPHAKAHTSPVPLGVETDYRSLWQGANLVP